MSVTAMVLSIVTAAGALAWGYSLGGFQGPASWLLIAGALWLLAQWRRWSWAGPLVLLLFIGAAAAGLWIGLPPSLMVIGAVGGLLGWDLAGFLRRIRLASPTDDVHGMELRHLARVSIVAAVSLVIAGLSLIVHVRVSFELAVALALLGALGLTRLAVWLQRENEL